MTFVRHEYTVGPCPNDSCDKGGQVKGMVTVDAEPTDGPNDKGIMIFTGKVVGFAITHDCTKPVTRSTPW